MLRTHRAQCISAWILVVGGFSGTILADEPAADLYSFSLFETSGGGAGARYAVPDDGLELPGRDVEDPTLSIDEETSWTFSVVPYLWMSSLRTDTTLGPVDGSSDLCFTDLLDHLDMAGMLRAEARKGRWGFYGEGLYLHLTEDATVKRQRAGFPPRIRINVDGELIQANLGLGAFYRLGEKDRYLDLMVGGRYTYLKVDANIAFLNPGVSKNLFDPIIGARIGLELSERWFAQFKGDIGGFGAGTEMTWGVQGIMGYRLSDMTSLIFGYRYYYIDIDSGRFQLEAQYHGPLLAVGFRF